MPPSTTTVKRGPGRPAHVAGVAPPAHATVLHGSAAVGAAIDATNAGLSDVRIGLLSVQYGQPRVLVHEPGCRGLEREVPCEDDLNLTGPAGVAWLGHVLTTERIDLAIVGEGALRAIIAAAWGDHEAVARFAGALEPVAKQSGAAVAIVYPPGGAPADPGPSAPEVDPVILPGLLKRGKVSRTWTHQERQALPALLDALGNVGGYWNGLRVEGHRAVVVQSGGKLSKRLRAEVHAAARTINRDYDGEHEWQSAADWVEALVREADAGVLIIGAEALAMDGVSLDAAELAKALNVAVGVVA